MQVHLDGVQYILSLHLSYWQTKQDKEVEEAFAKKKQQ